MPTEDQAPEPEETVIPPAPAGATDPGSSSDAHVTNSDTAPDSIDDDRDRTLEDERTLAAPIFATGNDSPQPGSGDEPAGHPENATWIEPGKSTVSARPTTPAADQQERFQLVENFARGGLGNIWLAVDGRIRREVAFKELLPKALKSSISVSRFLEEAQITGQLEHPGIVPIYELGTQRNGTPYYTMKLVRGETYDAAIKAYHELPARSTEKHRVFIRLLRNFIDICNTLAFAHDHNVIHRDLKPQNVMLGQFGETLVLDWGLAKVIKSEVPNTSAPWHTSSQAATSPDVPHRDDAIGTSPGGTQSSATSPTQSEHSDVTVDSEILQRSSQQKTTVNSLSGSGILRREVSVNERTSGTETHDGAVLGTPAYMAPEQARGEHDSLDPRADIYALGAILYRLLTNTTPLGKGTVRQIIARARDGEFKTPREHDSSIPRALEAICLKAMEKSPDDRYQSALELKEDVEAWLADEPVAAWPDPLLLRLRRWIRRHQTAVLSGVAVLITATVLPVAITTVRLNRLTDSVEQRFRSASVALTADNYQKAASLLDEAAGLLADEPELAELASRVERKRSAVATIVSQNELQREQQRRAESEAARHVAEINFQRAERERQRANQNFIIASAQRLVAESKAVRNSHPRLSMLLSVQAIEISRHRQEAIVPEALQNLHDVAATFGGAGLFGHEDQIRDCEISSDQRWLLTGSKDRTARLWDLNANNPQQTSIRLSGHEGSVNCVSLPSGNHWAITAGDDADVVAWDLTAPDVSSAPIVLRGHSLPVTCMAASADGQWLATSGVDADIRLWNLTGQQIGSTMRVLKGHTDTVNQLCFSPSGDRLFSAGESGTVRVWNIPTGLNPPADSTSPIAASQELKKHTSGVLTLAISPSGRWLVSGDTQGSVWLWDLRENPLTETYSLNGHRRAVTESAFTSISPEGNEPTERLATAGTDGNVVVWDLTDREPRLLAELHDHDGAVNDLVWSSHGYRLLTAGDDQTVRMYRCRSDGSFNPEQTASTLRAHEDAVWSLATHGNRLVSGALDGALQIWDLSREEPGMTPRVYRSHRRAIQQLATSSDSQHFLALSSDRDRRWSLWNRSTGLRFSIADTAAFSEAIDRATTIAWNPQAEMAVVAGSDGSVLLLTVSGGEVTSNQIQFTGLPVHAITFSANGEQLLVAGEAGQIENIDITSLTDGSAIAPVHPSVGDSRLLVIEANPVTSEFAAGSDDGGVLIGTPEQERRWLAGSHRGAVNDLAYSPDGNFLASGSDDRSIRVWSRSPDGHFEESPRVLVRHEDRVRDVTFSRDSRSLLSVSDDATAIVWSVTDRTSDAQTVTLTGHESAIYSGQFSDDGRWAVTGSDDGTVRLWDLRSDNPSASSVVIQQFGEPIRDIELIDQSRTMLVGTRSGEIFVWPLDPEQLVNRVTVSAGRQLSTSEAQRFKTSFEDLDAPPSPDQ